MAVEWNQVTWYSQIVAIVLFVAVFLVGFWLGEKREASLSTTGSAMTASTSTTQMGTPVIADATYSCDAGKTVHAMYRDKSVQLLLSDGRNLTVPQAISGSGARYANDDESFVFWNKGTTAFITEGSSTTFANCNQMPAARQ